MISIFRRLRELDKLVYVSLPRFEVLSTVQSNKVYGRNNVLQQLYSTRGTRSNSGSFLCNFTLCFVACTNVTIRTLLLAFSLIKSTIYVGSGGQFFVNFLSIYFKAIFHCFNCNTYLYISWYVCVSLIRLVIKALH